MINQNLLLTGDDGYNLTKSLRFRSSASAYLNRTFGTPTSRRIFTLSFWVKRGLISNSQTIMANETAPREVIGFIGSGGSTGDNFQFRDSTTGAYELTTTAVYRDTSAWYHFVIAFDTTQATPSNRIKMYANGIQVTSFATATYPSQNSDLYINNADTIYLGRRTSIWYLDGYLAEVNFIDGQALTPSSFGETSTQTGVWVPKKYTGTYGTNGFYLPFTDTTSTSTLGTDFSGNSNTWTVNNISLTAGTTYDSMTDVPTLTNSTTANYCVLNPLNKSGGMTLSEANLRMSMDSATGYSARGTIASSIGKWYAEAFVQNKTTQTVIGVCDVTLGANQDPIVAPVNAVGYIANDGTKSVNGTSSAYGATYTTNDIIGIALDMDALTVTFYKNNTSQGSIALGTTGLNYTFFASDENYLNTQIQWNFGQRPFSYTPPTGFVALNTFNLPTPTIGATASSQANKYFNAVTYTGAGAGTVITTGFYPDFAWMKNRTAAFSNFVQDSVRGGGVYLLTDTTDHDAAVSPSSTFSSTGLTIPFNSSYASNSSYNFVAWAWKANAGSTVSNTAGSITSTVSANTTAGFSIVTYTGTGATGTVGHGLGVAPSMIIVKRRSTTGNWPVYHISVGNNQGCFLNLTNAVNSQPNLWNSTTPTSSVFTVGTDTETNQSTQTLVAYCFAQIAGYSAFGSYTGNGSTDGPFVYLGFRPKFVMIKRTDSSTNGDWRMMDSTRDTYNVSQYTLYANLSLAEDTVAIQDFLSNGFKLRTTTNGYNGSGSTYIYMAFAEFPQKFSLAR